MLIASIQIRQKWYHTHSKDYFAVVLHVLHLSCNISRTSQIQMFCCPALNHAPPSRDRRRLRSGMRGPPRQGIRCTGSRIREEGIKKMPQSGVGSLQGKNTGNMPSAMCASSMNKSLIFTGGGTHPQCNPTNGHTYFHKGGTHPQCNPTNGHTYFHKGGGRTHKVTQRTDTHIFTGGDAPTM